MWKMNEKHTNDAEIAKSSEKRNIIWCRTIFNWIKCRKRKWNFRHFFCCQPFFYCFWSIILIQVMIEKKKLRAAKRENKKWKKVFLFFTTMVAFARFTTSSKCFELMAKNTVLVGEILSHPCILGNYLKSSYFHEFIEKFHILPCKKRRSET